jgi:hypothetical protein
LNHLKHFGLIKSDTTLKFTCFNSRRNKMRLNQVNQRNLSLVLNTRFQREQKYTLENELKLPSFWKIRKNDGSTSDVIQLNRLIKIFCSVFPKCPLNGNLNYVNDKDWKGNTHKLQTQLILPIDKDQ